MRILLLLLLIAAADVRAAVIEVGPFAGDLTESFESLNTGPAADNVSILGGTATLSNPYLFVYQPGTAAYWNLDHNGRAQIADGVKGIGVNQETTGTRYSDEPTATIVSASGVSAFGGYFGSCLNVNGQCLGRGIIEFVFYDSQDLLVDTFAYVYDHSATRDGLLDWIGFSFDTPISRLTFTGDYVALDSLRVSVPEPATLSLFSAGLLGMLAARRRGRGAFSRYLVSP